MKKIHIIGGGTFSHVRNHLALAAPAFGTTARQLGKLFNEELDKLDPNFSEYDLQLHLTKMADHKSSLVTNEDVSVLLDQLIADPETRVIILNAALCDYNGHVLSKHEKEYLSGIRTSSGSHAQRLKTADGDQKLVLIPANKLVGKIRKECKDIFVVGFKTTTGATSDEQYVAALNLLKANSLNLVVANDTVTRNCMIVTPEEARYTETTDRSQVLASVLAMTLSRMKNTFTRSTVIPGTLYNFQGDPLVPDNLRQVVNYLVERGAYKPFRGSTVGHFAVKLEDDQIILTSRRKTNYTEPGGLDLVEVHYEGDDKVVAFGAKPSVGGQSQRTVFRDHPGLDCIVHFHCPVKRGHLNTIKTASQWPNECGSHECGKNTSDNLQDIAGLGGKAKCVMLEEHGPNIVFAKDVPAEDIVRFIENNFDLRAKTGGLVGAQAA